MSPGSAAPSLTHDSLDCSPALPLHPTLLWLFVSKDVAAEKISQIQLPTDPAHLGTKVKSITTLPKPKTQYLDLCFFSYLTIYLFI